MGKQAREPAVRRDDILLSRRTLLTAAMAGAGLLLVAPARVHAATPLLIENASRLYTVEVARIVAPRSCAELRRAVRDWPGAIAVGGGCYSMGGQVAIAQGLHVDMRQMNKLVWLRPDAKTVRVEAGMRWRDLQDHIDGHQLSVRTMQSFANFTIGGAVSVNAHGRYVGHGPVGHSVRALQLVLADGQVVEADRQTRPELFRAAIGGYGAIGVITEVELDLDDNARIEQRMTRMPLRDYPAWFEREIRPPAKACLLHNADLLPPAFDEAWATNWCVTDKPVTVPERLIPQDRTYRMEQSLLWAVSELPNGDALQRKYVRPALLGKSGVAWRNHEASLDVRMLEPASRRTSTYVLQEYFIPVAQCLAFAADMAQVIRTHGAKVLNVSIRHSPRDEVSMLPWAREEVFSFVVYYKQGTETAAREAMGAWTRDMIDAALKRGGTYYLPYQLHASTAQFAAAYPQAEAFRAVKRTVDSQGRLSNSLWQRYL
ncbi:FAD/FMN-containing dehydrogenase [Variovorax boronicumulans]|uniref:FAD-binding oxidoreductase n=1 Tax=Variovorax boronicumulans TaxID=436515 RepID=UPI002785D027|nr:FAD-binding oxidoreductase [Variovorax boronicumulans]MDQ0073131.1 FAD/FMN-containing dehydrogenase [Variovorax boronicumulans]